MDVLAVFGGVMALSKRCFLLAVFGASVLIPGSLSSTIFGLESVLLYGEMTFALFHVIYLTFCPVALVLSVLSLNFLAKSNFEFS